MHPVRSASAFPRAIASGLQIAYPKIVADTLKFHVAALASLRPGSGGIPEPAETSPVTTPDVLLVPLLGATLAGARLGQGAGFYDRALGALRAAGPCTAIGLCWDVQIVEALPEDSTDERLDWIATPTRLVDCGRKR